MRQFVDLRPKCYAFLCTGKVYNNVFQHTRRIEKKTAKGVRRSVNDAHLNFAHYLDALNNFRTYRCRQNLIKSTLHTVHMCKVGLTAYDTKRWLCDDTIYTHAHGHRSTLLQIRSAYLILYLSLLYMPLSSLNVIEPVQNVKWCGVVTTTTVLYSPQLNTHEYIYISVAVVGVGGCAVPSHAAISVRITVQLYV